ncbi:MAG: purine-nucleoside phosphorylase [Bacteroidetes bacterium]|nr:purine-nucleoside phosphorylase [Bacteroidota bacterium]MBS1930330.1 purine-nucleoside phosphorylase [Bacteroidota bacterium]
MSIHIAAKKREIAPVVLLAGDPLRAKFIAQNNLKKVKRVNKVRNALYFTGTYKGKKITVGASGMGIPSIGIYSYELYAEYDVECIMRIGTCGAYLDSINVFDCINTDIAYSESTYAQTAFNFSENHISHQGKMFDVINTTAKNLGIPVLSGAIHSGDAFYRVDRELPKMAKEYNCLAAEMEAFALFANAKYFNKQAAALLTVSDNIVTHVQISAKEREKSLAVMTQLALESAVRL